jgi:hypothetical protein
MIELLDELTEIPFDIFWDKYMEINPGIYDRSKAEKEWFYMTEEKREWAFRRIGRSPFNEPYKHLQYFNLPF